MNDQSVNDNTEARLANALNQVAERTTVEPDWDRVMADARPAGRQDGRFGPASFAVAAAVMVLAGLGIALLSANSEEVAITADGVVILPGEVVLSDDPLIVSAAPAADPTFDTSALGQEVIVDPITEVDAGIEQLIDLTAPLDGAAGELVKATVIGSVDGQPWVTAVRDESGEQRSVSIEPGQVFRIWTLMGSGGTGIGDPVTPGSLRFIEPPDLEEDDWDSGVAYTSPEGWVEWGPLPAEVSVVTFADDEDLFWTRPLGGVALIPARIAGGESFTVQALAADGEVLATITQTAVSASAELDRPDTDPNTDTDSNTDSETDSETDEEGAAPDEDDAAAATEDQPILAGAWEIPDTTLASGPGSLGVTLVPMDDRLIVLHTENSGNDMVGEIYDPATGVATALEPSNRIWRANPAVAWTGEKLLIVGGSNGPGIDDQALVHNPELGTWRALPPPPDDLLPADEIIIGPGAWTGTELLLWQNGLALDPETEQWRAIADYPGPRRAAATMAWAADRLIVWGGCDAAVAQCDDRGERLLNGGYVYDPATDVWELMAPSPVAAGVDPIAVVAGDEVLFYSGSVDPGGTAARMGSYDPATDSWTVLPDPPLAPGQGAAGVWIGTHVVLWGGVEDAGTFNGGAVLNPETGNWFALPDAPVRAARAGHTMAWIEDRFYISGGGAAGPLVFILE